MIKKLYKKIRVDCLDYMIKIIKKSNSIGLNKTQYYKSEKGFQYLDIKVILEIYFKKLSSIQKYQHFLFEAINLSSENSRSC